MTYDSEQISTSKDLVFQFYNNSFVLVEYQILYLF